MESIVAWAWIIWIAIGAFAGWLAGRVMGSGPFGFFGDIAIGIMGSLLGGWIADVIGIFGGGIFWTFIVAFLGSLLLLWIVRLFKKA